MTKITALFFGPAKDFTQGEEETTLEFQETSVSLDNVLVALSHKYGEKFAEYIYNSCGIAVNLEYVSLQIDQEKSTFLEILQNESLKQITLVEGDELTVIPPVSSG
ncbi:unnamed protein product [Kuraishia capsulata CBS 1993]|uniref:Molybdopterin synthase sulfur carrier subunit n=1 Tax=Kuraishia capsulata CBS 1993 TaxID=1382522 RepID=W6MRH9_9ASCO|nr:uncharacterized protein KUCA_T00004954001 [Kuraishia capsulata CBS 1993]CDK28968.1 unnamed protein product [Kuraishia capsulata CBS 1993]